MNEKRVCFEIGTRECGLLCGGIGALVALSMVLFGFWSTLMIAAFFAVGYFLGRCNRKQEFVKTVINRLFPPKGE